MKYSEPVPFHKSMPGSKSVVIMKRYDDGIPEGFTPPKRKKVPQVRNARNEPIDDEIGEPAEKGNNTMTDPFYKMLDRQALARQQQTGESYAVAFTKIYEDPSNRAIVDAQTSEHLAQGEDAIFGTRLSGTHVAKAVLPDPEEDFVSRAVENRGPAHNKLHQMALEHSRRHGLSYAQSYTRLFTSPENIALRAGITAEAGIRTLTLEEARALSPSKPFPAYGNPGDEQFSSTHRPVGREGRGGQDF
jgi:hypothetical protein